MKRVVHVVPAPFDGQDAVVGGAERYALELARHMALVRPTTLISFGRESRTTDIGGLCHRVIGNAHDIRGQRTNPFSLALLPELRHAEVIHCHQQHVVASSLAALYGRLVRTKVFVTDLGGGGWDISGYVSTDSWYAGHLHISEYSRRVSGHTDRANAHVILGGVDAVKFAASLSGPRNGPVLFVGRLAPHKGIDLLIEALPEHLALEVIGRPYDDRYTEHLYRIAAGKRVSWRHDASDADIVAAYRSAACVVLPSVYQSSWSPYTAVPELLGQTLLEGMACGAPVICTDVASMPEIVRHGECGLVVPPNDITALRDAMTRLCADSELAVRFGAAGRQRAMTVFSWASVVGRCERAYQGART